MDTECSSFSFMSILSSTQLEEPFELVQSASITLSVGSHVGSHMYACMHALK